jgi:sulfoacetaldehyde dehydrogenase
VEFPTVVQVAQQPSEQSAEQIVAELLANARLAQLEAANWSQQRTDEAVTAVAWSLYQPEHARMLAELAVTDTGLGNVEDKIIKNQRKTFGTLRDLMRAKTVGVIEQNPGLGIVKYAKPVGVVAAITPSTNPAATPVNKAMMALKGRNAIIIAPSPSGIITTTKTVALMRAALAEIGAPENLVQVLPAPVNRALTTALMRACDLNVVTGSQNNVRGAYSSGKPAIGVGAGNVPVIIDTTANLDDAAIKIGMSKTFDNATSCSSENALIIVDEVYDAALGALQTHGAWLADSEQKTQIQNALWQDGKLNRNLIAKSTAVMSDAMGLPQEATDSRYFLVEEHGIGKAFPFSDEKLALVLTVYRAKDFNDAKRITAEILAFKGKGHSVGIHTTDQENAKQLASELDVVRVLVNQAHTFGNGGGFTSGLNFTLSMGCGTWQGNSISENLSYKHFINITHLSTEIPEDKPSESDLFASHWEKYGK